jgi:hypothetical protein
MLSVGMSPLWYFISHGSPTSDLTRHQLDVQLSRLLCEPHDLEFTPSLLHNGKQKHPHSLIPNFGNEFRNFHEFHHFRM